VTPELLAGFDELFPLPIDDDNTAAVESFEDAPKVFGDFLLKQQENKLSQF